MKIIEINKKQQEVTVKAESLNDLWTLYNVISKGDNVLTRTQRRIVLKEGSKGERKLMVLKLKVEDVAFHEFSNRLRIKGTILEGPEDFVSYGTYHTFNIEIGQKLTIIKEQWLPNELKRLKELSKFQTNFVILLIAIETGLSNLAIITNFSHNKIATIKKNIPGKRYEQSNRNKAYFEFFEDVQKVLEENLKNLEVNLIIICGPGNVRDQFINYLKEKSNSEYISKIKSIHASSGTESAIFEVMRSKELVNIKKNVKILLEAERIEDLLNILSTDSDLIVIGLKEVTNATEKGAIKELFLTDELIRGTSKTHKLEIEKIITDVENYGGIINILSIKHPTGEQIADLGSLVGILRYKL